MLTGTILTACLGAALVAAGCSKAPPALLPNKDKSLRKSATAFAADAKERHPYNADAPRGGQAVARAQVGYTANQLEVVNLSEETWNDVEIWVNGQYVVFVPRMKPRDLKVLNFRMLYDNRGRTFPLNNSSVRVQRVEAYRDGTMYEIPVSLAD